MGSFDLLWVLDVCRTGFGVGLLLFVLQAIVCSMSLSFLLG